MLILLLMSLAQTPAVRTPRVSIDGVYNGAYVCATSQTTFKLSLTRVRDGSLAAVFTFYPAPVAPREFTFDLSGTYNVNTRRFQLQPTRWETTSYSEMFPLNGTFEPSGSGGLGQVNGVVVQNGCRVFSANRDRGESARIDSVIAAQKAGTTAGSPQASASLSPQAMPRGKGS